jgi:hypothetical protein
MLDVGLDIHSARISICVRNGTGQVVHRSQVRGIDKMLRDPRGLPDRLEVCYEASCGYGHDHDLLRPPAARVLVAHSGQLRLIFRSKDKTDRNDAEWLAKLLYLGETPMVYVPSADVRAWRELVNCRGQVVDKRTRAKNTLRALLRGAGVSPPKHPGLWTKKGLSWLRQLELPAFSYRIAWISFVGWASPTRNLTAGYAHPTKEINATRYHSSCGGICCSRRSRRWRASSGASKRS